MRVLERASTLVPSCSVRHLRTVQFSYASQYDSVSLGTGGAGARFCMLRSTTRRCRWAPWSWCLVLASRAVVVEGLTSQPRVPRGRVRRRSRV